MRGSVLIHGLHEEYLGGEMVGVSAGPYPSGERAQGIPLVAPLLLLEEFLVEYDGILECQSADSGKKIPVDDYLVEQIPFSTVYV